MPSTREQKRAQMAYEKVHAVKTEPWLEDYGRQAKQLPALIHQCGLCQALAFLQAKGAADGGAAKRQLLDDLAATLHYTGAERLLKDARELTTPDYHLLGRDSLRCAEWLKRYSEALLRIDEPEPAVEGEEL